MQKGKKGTSIIPLAFARNLDVKTTEFLCQFACEPTRSIRHAEGYQVERPEQRADWIALQPLH